MLLPHAALAALLTATPAPAPQKAELSPQVAERLMGAALTQGGAWQKLQALTDGVGPRLSGSEGSLAAVRWAADRLKADGVSVTLEPVRVPRWVRGEEKGELLAAAGRPAHPLALTALGGSPGTPKEGLVADVVEVTSLEELAALGEPGVRGKVVLFGHRMKQPEDYGRLSALRGRGPQAAAKLGAVGALVRSLATASLRSPHTGSTVFEPGAPQIPAAALATEDAELLHRQLARGAPVRVRLVLGCRNEGEADSFNVVADVKGREKPQEVVLIGAHLDSWDLSPGAHDDGAGVAMVMETARLLAQLKPAPRRTVRVVLFMNEENGLRGARAYAQAHAAELPRHVAALEMDAGGFRPLGVALRAGAGADAQVRRWLAPLAQVGADTLLEGEAGGADLSPLLPAAVPFVGVRVDNARYFDYHHSASDTLDKVDPQDLARATAAVAWVTYALAESATPLPRPEPRPFPSAPSPAAPESKAAGAH